MFIKLKENSINYQHEEGVEIELIASFIDYFYYEREFVKDSINRLVIVCKYGSDYLRIKKVGKEFENWYNKNKKQ